jgi:hypothetical protein
MPNETLSQETSFGYLSVINSADHGYFGGYLIIGPLGRPLEFHCTAPVRPSRAQQILYGPTLEPFLLGEQIAGTILDAAKLKPRVILANCEPTLYIRSRLSAPIALLRANPREPAAADPASPPAANDASIDFLSKSASSSGPHESFTVATYEFLLPIGFESDRDEAIRLLSELAEQIDLAEPFDRIEEAIREAQRLGGGAETHDQAA